MKRLASLLLFLAGCRSAPTAPPTPLYNVQRGPVEGEPGVPSVRRFTAWLDGDSLRVSADLVPPPGLMDLGKWDWQMEIGRTRVGRNDYPYAEYVLMARSLEDPGAGIRALRRTAGSGGPGGWGPLVFYLPLKTSNARRIELAISLSALDNSNPSMVAVWLTFSAGDYYERWWTHTQSTSLTWTE